MATESGANIKEYQIFVHGFFAVTIASTVSYPSKLCRGGAEEIKGFKREVCPPRKSVFSVRQEDRAGSARGGGVARRTRTGSRCPPIAPLNQSKFFKGKQAAFVVTLAVAATLIFCGTSEAQEIKFFKLEGE